MLNLQCLSYRDSVQMVNFGVCKGNVVRLPRCHLRRDYSVVTVFVSFGVLYHLHKCFFDNQLVFKKATNVYIYWKIYRASEFSLNGQMWMLVGAQ